MVTIGMLWAPESFGDLGWHVPLGASGVAAPWGSVGGVS